MTTRRPHAAQDLTVLTLETDAAGADALAADLERRLGRPVVQLQRPGESRVWLELYFERDIEALLARRATERLPGVRGAALRGCAARDWQAFWRRHFHAHDVGRRLRVVPVWEARRDRVAASHPLAYWRGLQNAPRK